MSPQKHAAQIANSKLSHGPRTVEGKARSSRNGYVHGFASAKHFISPHDREEFNRHCDAMVEALAPVGIEEEQLADSIAIDQFRWNRLRALENEIFCLGYDEAGRHPASNAKTWERQAKNLALLSLYEQRISRSLTRLKAELAAKQAARKAAEAAESKAETVAAEPPRGFARSSAASAVPDPQPVAPDPVAEGREAPDRAPGGIRNAA